MATELLTRAHERAQRRFHDMLEGKKYSDPKARETRLYVEAERLVDELLVNLQWEQAKAEMDRLQSSDHDYHDAMNVSVSSCDDCLANAEPGYGFDYWTEPEMRLAMGDR